VRVCVCACVRMCLWVYMLTPARLHARVSAYV